jgi:phage terminase small subunit
MRGPAPRPTKLKVLAGVRPCRINRNEPSAPVGVPDAPDYLDATGKGLWDELAGPLGSTGVLTLADRHALGLLCDTFSRWRAKPGDIKVADQFRKLLAEFGLTPSSRSRIRVNVEPEDDLDRFMGTKNGGK